MMHGMGALYDELHATHLKINMQIKATEELFLIDKNNGSLRDVESFTIYQAVRSDGIPVLEPLLTAKAQLLSGMAALKAADVNSKAPRR